MSNKLEKFLEWTVAIVSVPLIVLNLLGGIISFIWLAILGEWSTILYGSLYIIFGSWLVGIFLIPGMIFMIPIVFFEKKKNTAGLAISGFMNLFYVFAVIAGSSYLIYLNITDNLTNVHLLPLLIWSYSVAISPWTYMASKEERSSTGFDGTLVTLYFTEIGLVIASVLIACGLDLSKSFTIFSVIMVIPLLMATYMVVVYMEKEKENLELSHEEDIGTKNVCSKCNSENIEEAKYCKSCGAEIDNN